MGKPSHAKLVFPLIVSAGIFFGACGSDDGGGSPPVIEPLQDQVATVNTRFTLQVVASDPDGDTLKFGFNSTIADIGTRAGFDTAGNKAVFHWTPLESDIGSQSFDFTVSDGSHTAKETITIEVKPETGSSTAPVFRKPLGTGTSLDLTQKKCLELDIVVEDADSAGVTISQEAPVLDGATLDQTDGLSGTWNWCPSKEQIEESDRHVLKLAADDGDNPPTTKNYLIVLRKAPLQNCPGAAPVVEHTSQGSVQTVDDLVVEAHITDDQGLKYEPLLYYTSKPPSDPPNLDQMNQLTMESMSGDMKDGTWRATLPNPVATQPGASASLFYLIEAWDDDDASGDCDHLTRSPASGAHEITVTNPNGTGPVECVDDEWEDKENGNDTRQDAYEIVPGLDTGEHAGLKSCPGSVAADEDWYPIDIPAGGGTVSAMLDGGDTSDLDLALVDVNGTVVVKSDGTDSLEFVESCVQQGVYYLHVYTWQNTENTYTLSYDFAADNCNQTCTDDGSEPDDDADHARDVTLGSAAWTSDTNAICPGNEDWYQMIMFAGETLHVTLTFDQANAKEDLDIILYQEQTNLTPCDETEIVGCDTNNGQSGTSNEHMVWPIETDAVYYVVVRGFDGSENLYDICIGLEDTDCPIP